jgi:F-type H+-transporting ATPase subunit epsilon
MAKTKNLPLFPLKLVTPAGVAFEGNVEQVIATDPVGQFGVLADHVNFITALMPGHLTIQLPEGQALKYYVADGLAQVADGAMTITVSELHDLGTADADKAEAAAKTAGRRLEQFEVAKRYATA